MTKKWMTKECVEMLSDTMLRSEVIDAIEVAVLAEREACAKICDETRYTGYSPPEDGAAPEYYDAAAESCAEEIRARGKN